jgi:hypothetical protein
MEGGILVAGYWMLDTGCWIRVAGYRLSDPIVKEDSTIE